MRSRRVRGGRRSALALLTVVALVVSVALGGRPYFFCPEMNEASFHACCARAAATHAQSATVDDDACCSGRRLGTPDPGVVAQQPAPSLHAPLVAVVPACAPCLAPRLSLVRRFAHEARAGPGDAREHRLRSMVFLT